jgi:MFS family permease
LTHLRPPGESAKERSSDPELSLDWGPSFDVSIFKEFRGLDRRVWHLAWARLVVMSGFSMVLPFLGIYLTVERRQPAPAVVVGVIMTIAGVGGAIMQWVAGDLSDRVGRRPLMLASMYLRAANLAGLGLATATDASVVVIGALVVLNNMLRAFFDPVANAVVADLAPPEQRVAAFSLQRVGTNIGWAAGPAVGFLGARFSYSSLFFLSVPVCLAATFALARIEIPTLVRVPRPPSWRELLSFHGDRVFVRFLAATTCFFVLQAQLYQTLPIYAARVLHIDRGRIGAFYILNGVMVVALQLPAVRYIRRLGTRRALALGCLGYAVAYAAVGLAPGYAAVLACVAGVTLSEIIVAPAQQASVAGLAPPGRIGLYSGRFGLCQIAGQSLGPLVGTAALDAMPPRAAWFLLALFGVTAALTYRSNTAHPRC